MREIKFRRSHFDENNNFMYFTYWGFLNHKDEFDYKCFKSPSNSNKSRSHKDEQFTGLKDKNGVEIYEGDKLCYNDCGEPIKVVEYSLKNGNYIMRFEKGGGFVDTLPYFTERNCWVTGNIHEK